MKRKPKTTLVEITQLDIRHGVPKTSDACPVARSMTRALGGRRQVLVYGGHWEFDGQGIIHRLPARVQNFIKRFDSHDRVEPMTFRITRP